MHHFCAEYMGALGQPVSWMPRLVDFRRAGRDDLVAAISRYGGTDDACARFGLVPYREWGYFDRNRALASDLLAYLREKGWPTDTMPDRATLEGDARGRDLNRRLSRLGGRSLVGRRLGLALTGRAAFYNDKINYGPFSLEFAVEVLEYIKETHFAAAPGAWASADMLDPETVGAVALPPPGDLRAHGRRDLADLIEEYGGPQQVARRLGLVYEDDFLEEERELVQAYLRGEMS
mmetsp:Transcript_49633/g.82958  ORF Transcript_49633/g.82958 Transcript_49633/m.82958 type:complete len:234 (+) Transcript_49633:3-704(+)